jgi:hypothetical protein
LKRLIASPAPLAGVAAVAPWASWDHQPTASFQFGIAGWVGAALVRIASPQALQYWRASCSKSLNPLAIAILRQGEG